MPGKAALLLVDLQRDYFDRPSLVPSEAQVTKNASELLEGFRAAKLPVAHIRTQVSAAGENAMPHWSENLICVEGTAGEKPPIELQEIDGEMVAAKQFFRGFANPTLESWLRARGVTKVVIAGLYTHACIRETALDAYELGFEVEIATDSIGSNAPEHASESLEWLGRRAAKLVSNSAILGELHNDSETNAIEEALTKVSQAQKSWSLTKLAERKVFLNALITELESAASELAQSIHAEIHKPLTMAKAEVARAIEHVKAALDLPDLANQSFEIAAGVKATNRPLGVVAILMPFNNPVALPISKIAPALALGNAVAFKPSEHAPKTSKLLIQVIEKAGLAKHLVEMFTGGAQVAKQLIESPQVTGVAVTGSIVTGRQIAQSCARLGKPLQAELGGNNAAIVLADANLDTVVAELIENAFGYQGQRCTALRRFVVEESILEEFKAKLAAQLEKLTETEWQNLTGEMISQNAKARVERVIDQAKTQGHQVVTARGLATVFEVKNPQAQIVQEETFGPIAVIQPARNLEHAIELANGVEQGLVMAACTKNQIALEQIQAQAQVGIFQVGAGQLPVHAKAPFGGVKASGFGPAEHGIWDAQFFVRPQAIYGS